MLINYLAYAPDSYHIEFTSKQPVFEERNQQSCHISFKRCGLVSIVVVNRCAKVIDRKE